MKSCHLAGRSESALGGDGLSKKVVYCGISLRYMPGFLLRAIQLVSYKLAGKTVIPYGSVILLTALPPPSIPAFPLRVRSCGSTGFWESLRLLPKREPSPFSSPFTPFVGFTDGCLNPVGGLLELADGDREG